MASFRVRNSSSKGWTLALAAGTLFSLAGCGGSQHGADVSGLVTLDGERLTSGSVIFAPIDAAANNAYGAVDESGRYELVTNRTPGLVPGKYRVAVTMYEKVDVKPGERSMVEPKLLTPPKYADVSTSGLEFDVPAGSSTIDVELVSK